MARKVSMHLLQPVVTSLHPLVMRVIPMHECTPSSNSQTKPNTPSSNSQTTTPTIGVGQSA